MNLHVQQYVASHALRAAGCLVVLDHYLYCC
jgi:hypothetical protein